MVAKAQHGNYTVSHATYEGNGRRLWIDRPNGEELCTIMPDEDGSFINPYNPVTALGKIVDELIKVGKELPVGNYTFSYF